VAEYAKALNERGVPVVIGAHGQLAGLAAHWELWMMVQGGFSPFEALRGATIDGARYFGMDARDRLHRAGQAGGPGGDRRHPAGGHLRHSERWPGPC
jgi:imidazolonepropionase-like amidohydrolase